MLELYQRYTREEVHNIFEPRTKFTPQSGTWGLQGIITLKETQDYIFFVTLGSSQSGHHFDEAITWNGVLSWQSQPSQSLRSPMIHKFIHHNELEHNIYLLFRSSRQEKRYFYLGNLAYLSHDNSRENPVYFKWQILNWNPPEQICRICNVAGYESEHAETKLTPHNKFNIQMIARPHITPACTFPAPSNSVRSYTVNFSLLQQQNVDLGLRGEFIVLHLETQELIAAGREDLAEQVILSRELLGNAAPYDIKSFTPDGNEKFIEVKTTKRGPTAPFYLSARELAFYKAHRDSYYLYRLCNFCPEQGRSDIYISRSLDDEFIRQSVKYKLSPI